MNFRKKTDLNSSVLMFADTGHEVVLMGQGFFAEISSYIVLGI